MAELSVVQAWLMISIIASIFLSGLFWCFCCGTCVGRSMLRNTGLFRYAREGADNRQWSHLPQNHYDEEEELRYLNTWSEHDEEEDEEDDDTQYNNHPRHL